MATATKTRTTKTAAAKAATKKGGTAKAPTTKATKAANKAAEQTAEGPSKTELRKARDAEMTETMLAMRAEGESWSKVAEELNITPGKAQFLWMLHCVATKEVPALKWSDDDELATVVRDARAAADEHSSWGWIAARTGVSEGKIKRLSEEAGWYVPGQENISVERAKRARDAEGEVEVKATRKGRGKAAAKAEPVASKAAKAKARTRKARSTETDPS